MVMVFGEILGQLVPGKAPRRDHSPDDPDLFQHHEVSVHGALGQARSGSQDVVDGERLRRRVDDLHQLPAQGRVALSS